VRIPFDKIALYGAQIHDVVPDAAQFRGSVQALLTGQGIEVRLH
jgi:hypothetical protein